MLNREKPNPGEIATGPEKPWNQISKFYDTYQNDIWYGAADNIETAWPVMLDAINKYFPHPAGHRALDFGCGAGMFCKKLEELGFDVTGMDLSPEMVAIGIHNLDPKIDLKVGDTDSALKLAQETSKFDLVTSIMVLQFIEDTKLSELADAVKQNGYLMLVNHNPERLQEKGVSGTLPLADTDVRVPIYQRTSQNYDELLERFGFKRVLEEYVKQGEEFLKKYGIQNVTKNPKYLILGYQKVGAA